MKQNKFILSPGQYDGSIQARLDIDGCIVSNTQYVVEKAPEWHAHENLHIALVFQKAKSETRHREVYTKPEGNIFFYHSEESHRYETFEAVSRSTNIEIGEYFLKSNDLCPFALQRHIEHNLFAKSLILRMQWEMINQDQDSFSSIQTLLLELLTQAATSSDHLPPWAIKLKELLQDEWADNLQLADLSRITGVHPVTISKNFRRYFHCTLGEYKRKIKVKKSISLIRETNWSLSEIAHYCQFSDQSHFIRTFRQYTGFSPNAFRKL